MYIDKFTTIKNIYIIPTRDPCTPYLVNLDTNVLQVQAHSWALNPL